MKTTTLFSIYAAGIVALVLGLAWLTLYSLEKSRWWDARTALAQDSYRLHLQLEANIFRLFKQHGDALLIGDRDGGAGEVNLNQRIKQDLVDIREVIAREIQMVGEEEIEELAFLDEIEADVKNVTAALASFTETGEEIASVVQVERLATLLDRQIDRELTRKIEATIAGEIAEVAEVTIEAAAFRQTNRRLAIGLVGLSLGFLAIGVISYKRHIRRPLAALQDKVTRLRKADYTASMALSGGHEFRDLGRLLGDMAQNLAQREASRDEQRRDLENKVESRTRELQSLVTQLERGDTNRKQLMADISHELRTPLAIILGEADVALRTARDMSSDVSDAFARIRDSARHTNQIVDDMLTVARHEAGQLRLNLHDADLRAILRDASEMFPRPVNLQLPDKPVRMRVDAVRLRQSILALFQNALRYGGPNITAVVDTGPGHVRIIIEDDGPGMSAEDKAQAFERFFRGSNAAGITHEGNGLGLPIVKTIVEAHDGQVSLEDSTTGGLRVVIAMPSGPRMNLVHDAPARKDDMRRA